MYSKIRRTTNLDQWHKQRDLGDEAHSLPDYLENLTQMHALKRVLSLTKSVKSLPNLRN